MVQTKTNMQRIQYNYLFARHVGPNYSPIRPNRRLTSHRPYGQAVLPLKSRAGPPDCWRGATTCWMVAAPTSRGAAGEQPSSAARAMAAAAAARGWSIIVLLLLTVGCWWCSNARAEIALRCAALHCTMFCPPNEPTNQPNPRISEAQWN